MNRLRGTVHCQELYICIRVTVELQAYYTICKARNTNTATTTKIPIAIARSTVIGFLPSCS